MKKVLVLVGLVVLVVGGAVLLHKSEVSAYEQGCKDSINNIADGDEEGHKIDQDVLNRYCRSMANMYEGKK